ncbi:MAG: hypothetical protein IJX30_02950 [Clostridia bacterium]|nr:hypothetical protein [Clostridia bacterium]
MTAEILSLRYACSRMTAGGEIRSTRGLCHSVGMTVNRKVAPLGMTSIPNSKLSGMTRAVLQRESPLTGSK